MTDDDDMELSDHNYDESNDESPDVDQQEDNGKEMHSNVRSENKNSEDICTDGFDLGIFSCSDTTCISNSNVELAVRDPQFFPKDYMGNKFPRYILQYKSQNGEIRPRDWLMWSDENEALFCFTCRLFGSKIFTCFQRWLAKKQRMEKAL